MTTNNIYLIGNQTEWESYSQGNSYNTDLLPIKNLPMCYFPFFYNNSELSIEKMKNILTLYQLMQEVAVDCLVLNDFHKNGNNIIQCHKFN